MTHRPVLLALAVVLFVTPALAQQPAPEDPDAARLVGPIHDVDVKSRLVFSRYGKDRRLTLDLYVPRTPGPHPTMLVVPGGAWRMTFKWVTFARALAREGIAAAAMSHRPAPRHVHPAQIEDCRRALQFLRHNAAKYSLDPNRIGALGASSGGHLSALLATEGEKARANAESPLEKLSTRPTCAVSFSGPMFLVPHEDEPPTSLQIRMVAGFLGRQMTNDPEKDAESLEYAKTASPQHHLTRDDPPIMLIHGEKDRVVPVGQSRRMAAALKKLSMEHDFVEVKGAGHAGYLSGATRPGGETPEFWKRLRVFLKKHLVKARAEGAAERSSSR